jgi:hypothetical protein
LVRAFSSKGGRETKLSSNVVAAVAADDPIALQDEAIRLIIHEDKSVISLKVTDQASHDRMLAGKVPMSKDVAETLKNRSKAAEVIQDRDTRPAARSEREFWQNRARKALIRQHKVIVPDKSKKEALAALFESIFLEQKGLCNLCGAKLETKLEAAWNNASPDRIVPGKELGEYNRGMCKSHVCLATSSSSTSSSTKQKFS